MDSFSSGSGINVMIINTQAFAASMNEEKNVEGRKGDAAARIISSKRDEFGTRRPIDVIAANRPIVMDEPQKMGGEVTQKTLQKFNPKFQINYSAAQALWKAINHKYNYPNADRALLSGLGDRVP